MIVSRSPSLRSLTPSVATVINILIRRNNNVSKTNPSIFSRTPVGHWNPIHSVPVTHQSFGSSPLLQRYLTTTRVLMMDTPRYSAKYVTDKLQKELQPVHLDVVDVSDGCGAKFECVIVSATFEGKPMLQRHRIVNECLSEELKTIHAFSMRTLTPSQWDKIKQQQ